MIEEDVSKLVAIFLSAVRTYNRTHDDSYVPTKRTIYAVRLVEEALNILKEEFPMAIAFQKKADETVKEYYQTA